MNIETTSEYADLITSMYLCKHFNPDDNYALKRTVKRVKRRMSTPDMKSMCKGLIRTKKPLTIWLNSLETTIVNTGMTLTQFIREARTKHT